MLYHLTLDSLSPSLGSTYIHPVCSPEIQVFLFHLGKTVGEIVESPHSIGCLTRMRMMPSEVASEESCEITRGDSVVETRLLGADQVVVCLFVTEGHADGATQ